MHTDASINSVLTILILMSVGWVGAKAKLFNHDTALLFSKIVSNISLPALMIATITTQFPRQLLISSVKGLAVPLLSILLCWIVGKLLAIAFIPEHRRGIFITMFVASNTIFVGLPVNISLFGESSVPFALLYYLINTVFFWTAGIHMIGRDAHGARRRSDPMQTLKNIFTPPLTCLVVALFLVLAGIRLPEFATSSMQYIGALTTPLSLFFIGITLSEMTFAELKPDAPTLLILAGRFALAPLTVVLLVRWLPIAPLMRDVFLMQAAMPVMAQSAVLAKVYGSDHEFAAKAVSLSTAVCLATIPLTFGALKLLG